MYLSRLLSFLIIAGCSLIFGAAATYYLLNTEKAFFVSIPEKEVSQEPIQRSEVRELLPGGYIIADQLFFSPTIGLSFTGQLKNLYYKNDEFRSSDLPGVVQLFTKKEGQNIIEAMEEVVQSAGGDPARCDFSVDEYSGAANVTVTPKIAYEPTEKEIFASFKKRDPALTLKAFRKQCDEEPVCEFAKQSLIQTYNASTCSKYSTSTAYHDASYFKYVTAGNGSNTFIYVHSEVGGGDMPWMDHVDLYSKFIAY